MICTNSCSDSDRIPWKILVPSGWTPIVGCVNAGAVGGDGLGGGVVAEDNIGFVESDVTGARRSRNILVKLQSEAPL